jgi:DNA-binding CsgD family transcriptional regulator
MRPFGRTGRKHDLVAVIEAAYAPAATEQAWVEGIAEAAQPCLDEGLGLNVYTFDARDPAKFRVPACAGVGGTPVDARVIEKIVNHGTPELTLRAYSSGQATLFSELRRELEAEHIAGVKDVYRAAAHFGSPEVLAVRGADPSRRGCLIACLLPAEEPHVPRAQRTLLTCLGSHLASGWRLRRDLPEGGATVDAADAILDGKGRLVHHNAADVATQRPRIEHAFERRLRARGRLRAEAPEAAVALWQAMIAGEWTLVDHVDRDGKRFVLARRNRPGVGDPGALTLRERQVAKYAALGCSVKHIAYELGLAASTVRERLNSALRKLRLRNPGQLVALLGPSGSAD